MENKFDVIVIGSGPGGYVCAIKSAQLGLKTACIESSKTLGGTCLNVGCIPSKSLLNSSEMCHKIKKDFNNLGIEAKDVKLNLAKMMNHKTKSVTSLTAGIEFLFKKNKVTHLRGKGSVVDSNTISVLDNFGKSKEYKTKNIVIGTGSSPISVPGIKIDEENVVSSTGALSFNKVPEELVVIGGGYIGLELSSVWNRLGSKVTVIEFSDYIIPGVDLSLIHI